MCFPILSNFPKRKQQGCPTKGLHLQSGNAKIECYGIIQSVLAVLTCKRAQQTNNKPACGYSYNYLFCNTRAERETAVV